MGANGRWRPPTASRSISAVASQSDRVKVVDFGPTTEGHRTIAAIVSAPDNIRNPDASARPISVRRIHARFRPTRPVSSHTHKAVPAAGGGIHASEIGATQAANELLYSLATASDAATRDVLRNVVIILIPSLNPDGHRLVVDWYNKEKGTPYEGGPMPWLYHKYAGHDINRDAFMMNMPESRNLSRFFYTNWHPRCPHDAPDGDERTAIRRSAERGSDRSQLRSDHLARGGPARQRDDARARARSSHRGRVECDLRLLLARLRRLGSPRAQHRLPSNRSRGRQGRDAGHGVGARASRQRPRSA
jgi:hypothetical protein